MREAPLVSTTALILPTADRTTRSLLVSCGTAPVDITVQCIGETREILTHLLTSLAFNIPVAKSHAINLCSLFAHSNPHSHHHPAQPASTPTA
jgi:hypothetical protein